MLLLSWAIVASIVAFLQFEWDKRQAVRGGWRISESTLLFTALLGGTPGAYLGRARFRHKTRKQPFSTELHVVATLQVGLALGWIMVDVAPLS